MSGMIHLVGLPHTSMDEEQFSTCAFTTKAARWTRVLSMIGREVTCYWAGGESTVGCEVVEVVSDEQRVGWFGGDVGQRLPDLEWDPTQPYWQVFNERAIEEVRKRLQPGDTVAVMAGNVQQSVVDAFPDHVRIEPAVGYEGLARGTFCCFESYAWMHNRYGAYGYDGRAFDAVVPNFVDPDDFEVGGDCGYALYVGRLTARKGPQVADEAARLAGVPLLMAGAGGVEDEDGVSYDAGSGRVTPTAYLGVVDPYRRRTLMSEAAAVIVPTLYVEPFGTVHVEAMMSGVPVVAPDWGVFTETVEEGVDGWRYRTLAEAADGLLAARRLRGETLRRRTAKRFSLEAVSDKFDRWLWGLDTLTDGSGGWYSTETYAAAMMRATKGGTPR
jgi:hypothetical protein